MNKFYYEKHDHRSQNVTRIRIYSICVMYDIKCYKKHKFLYELFTCIIPLK